jgi:hypothetical protein
MNGLSPEGSRLDAVGDAEQVQAIARTPDAAPEIAQTAARPDVGSESSGEVAAALQLDSATEAAAAEVAQLEALLDTRSRELQEQRAEVARIRVLLRDAVDHFESSAAAASEQVMAEMRRERDQAVVRALESEAARADIRFRLDEVMGHLAAAGAAEGALPGERLDVTCARLSGTVRGLLSALAETQEGREVAQARLMLAEQDLAELRGTARELERDQAEAREQIELEQMKGRQWTERFRGGLDAAAAAALRGERDGMRACRDEAERAFGDVSSRILELEQRVMRETESRSDAGAGLAAAQAERIVLLEELSRARAKAASAHASLEESEAERTRSMQTFAQQLDAAHRGAAEPQVRAARHADALREAREQWNALGSALRAVLEQTGTWSGLDRPSGTGDDATQPGVPTYIEAVEGLEVQLAASEERVRQMQARLASAAATVGELAATAPTAAAAEQLSALRALLERG